MSDLHSSKANAFIDDKDEGSSIIWSELHKLKQDLPIVVTDDGIEICFNDEHFSKE